MKRTIRVAAVQMSSSLDKAKNLLDAERLVQQAAQLGAELVVLPELFNLYGNLAQAAIAAEPLTGPTSQLLSRLAKEHHLWLVGGSFAEKVSAQQRAYNTSLTIDPYGQIRGTYRKMHLFDVDLGEKLRVQESQHLLAGDEITCIDTELALLGVSICYDLRFPELYREQSRRGAEVLCIPAAFTRATGRDHWELLIRARAVENQCYVIAANQVGQHAIGSESYGHSLIVDPWGKTLAEASNDAPGVIIANLLPENLAAIREKLPALSHRRLK